MAYKLVLDLPTPTAIPAGGWKIGYRILGSTGAYTLAGPFFSMPIQITTADPVGTLYEGYIKRVCSDSSESTNYFWQTPCGCTGAGYVIAPDNVQCQKNDTQAPTITSSGFCLAPSQNGAYGNFCARVYAGAAPFLAADIVANPGTPGAMYFGESTTAGQWANPTSSASIGPLNREGVWIDSDCNGTKDALGAGTQTTIAYVYNNPGPAKTIYVGIGADNQFQLIVNGATIADTGTTGSDKQFKIWHIFPINVVTGPNYINAVAVGDGSVNDAIGMVVYDETNPATILAATDDSQLNIPFATHTLRGTNYTVATCPSGWSLDTSGGASSYICRRTTYKSCNTLA
jgi:hypothetical protein